METLSRIIGNHVRLFRDGATAATLIAAIASRARNAANVATIVTAEAHNLTSGDVVDIAGVGDTEIIKATASRARAANVATIVTGAAHGFTTGDLVDIAGVGGAGYNGLAKEITVVDATTFTYASVGDDEDTTVDANGTATKHVGTYNHTDVTVTVVDATTFTYPNIGDEEATIADGGTVTKNGTASRTSRPLATDTGWIDVGIVSDLSFDRAGTSDQIFAPNPGKIELYDVIETKVINGLKFTAEQISPVAIEVLMGTAALSPASTTYTPAEKITKKFWVEVKQYDHDDQLFNTVYLYCYTKINGEVKFADKHPTFAFECQKLVSALNQGTLA